MPWVLLILAGCFEVLWASLLAQTQGFTRLAPSIGFLFALGISMFLLSVAIKSIPVGLAYAVWVGIGVVGTFVVAVVVKGDRTSPAQVVALMALVASIIAMKLTA